MLVESVKNQDGRIIKQRTMRNLTIQTNKKGFVGERNARLEAIWEDALNQLVENNLIEDRGYKGEVFSVTRLGYKYADVLQNKSSAESSAAIQQNDLEFDGTSEPYISKKDHIRYCHKCFHSSSQRVPLKEQQNGWYCSVCKELYRNPNYKPPTRANNDYNPSA